MKIGGRLSDLVKNKISNTQKRKWRERQTKLLTNRYGENYSVILCTCPECWCMFHETVEPDQILAKG